MFDYDLYSDLQTLQNISPFALQQYINMHMKDFKQTYKDEVICLYHRQDDQIKIPLRQEFHDYALNVIRFIEDIVLYRQIMKKDVVEALIVINAFKGLMKDAKQ